MSRPPEIAGSTAAGDVPAAAGDIMRDWQAVRGDATIQYAPLPPYKPPVQTMPEWLKLLGQWLQDLFAPLGKALGVSWPAVQIVLIALTALAVLFIVWRLVEPLLGRGRGRSAPAPEPDWSPGRAQALALLEDADRLAAEGRFAEATHLLLRRSVGHIADARPDWLHPASTAREIMRMPALPQRARAAFAAISERVERSRYALRALDAADWTEARAAYADFALQTIDAPQMAVRA